MKDRSEATDSHRLAIFDRAGAPHFSCLPAAIRLLIRSYLWFFAGFFLFSAATGFGFWYWEFCASRVTPGIFHLMFVLIRKASFLVRLLCCLISSLAIPLFVFIPGILKEKGVEPRVAVRKAAKSLVIFVGRSAGKAAWFCLAVALHGLAALAVIPAPKESAFLFALAIVLSKARRKASPKKAGRGKSSLLLAIRLFLCVVFFGAAGVVVKKAMNKMIYIRPGEFVRFLPDFDAYQILFHEDRAKIIILGGWHLESNAPNSEGGGSFKKKWESFIDGFWRNSHIYALDSTSGEILQDLKLPGVALPPRGVYEKSSGRLFVVNNKNGEAGNRNGIFVVDLSAFRTVKILPAPGCAALTSVRLDERRGEVLALCEHPANLYHYRLDTLDLMQSDAAMDGKGLFYDFIVADDRLIAADYLLPRFLLGTPSSRPSLPMSVEWKELDARGRTMGMARGANDGLIFMAKPLERSVRVLKPSSLDPTDSIPVNSAPRCLTIDSKANILFVGDFFSGLVESIDLSTGRRLDRWSLGHRPRDMTWDPVSRRLYAATPGGVYVINVGPRPPKK